MPHRHRYERTPDTVTLLSASAAGGVVMLAADTHPPALIATAGSSASVLWAAVFTVAAAVSLIGVLTHAPVGWAVELGGRVPLGLTAGGYSVVLVRHSDTVGVALVAAIIGAVGVASLIRAGVLMVRLYRYHRAVHSQGGAM